TPDVIVKDEIAWVGERSDRSAGESGREPRRVLVKAVRQATDGLRVTRARNERRLSLVSDIELIAAHVVRIGFPQHRTWPGAALVVQSNLAMSLILDLPCQGLLAKKSPSSRPSPNRCFGIQGKSIRRRSISGARRSRLRSSRFIFCITIT